MDQRGAFLNFLSDKISAIYQHFSAASTSPVHLESHFTERSLTHFATIDSNSLYSWINLILLTTSFIMFQPPLSRPVHLLSNTPSPTSSISLLRLVLFVSTLKLLWLCQFLSKMKLSNYIPISNLQFHSTLLEWVMANQLKLPWYQQFFKSFQPD